MSGLKKIELGLRTSGTSIGNFSGQGYLAVTPDEIDRYEVVVINPSGAVTKMIGTAAVAGTAATGAVVLVSALPDWPRNVEFALAGSATGMAGTLVLNGRDQFGAIISETFGYGSADNGGTVVGTKVFAQFTSGTVTFGTAIGNGTSRIGLGTTGTTSLLGLPFKLGGTTDVKHIGLTVGTGAILVNGGTIAAFVNVPMSAVLAPVNIPIGTYTVSVWAKPSFNGENLGVMANLPQRT